MKKIFFVIALLIFLTPYPVFAKTPEVDHVAGLVEKLQEKISLYTKFSNESKAKYKLSLLNKRLGEVVYAFEADPDLIEKTSTRYTTYVQDYADFVSDNKIEGVKKESIESIENNLKILEKKQNKLEYESGWWMFNQHSINASKDSINKIKSI